MYMYMYILSHFVMRGASNNRCPFPGRKIWPCMCGGSEVSPHVGQGEGRGTKQVGQE